MITARPSSAILGIIAASESAVLWGSTGIEANWKLCWQGHPRAFVVQLGEGARDARSLEPGMVNIANGCPSQKFNQRL